MSRFSSQSLEAVTTILERWAKEQLQEAISKLGSKKIKTSGALQKSLKYKIANEAGTKARLAVQYLYYGTILDRDFIRFGNKGISTKRIEDWLKNGGLNKIGGYRGQEKTVERQVRSTAFAIRRSWRKAGGRKGRRWNFKSELENASEELTEQIFDAFQQEAYEAILQELSTQ